MKPVTPRKESGTLQQSFILKNRSGLHARPSALLLKTVRAFQCEISVECHGELANAQSIMGLMALAAVTNPNSLSSSQDRMPLRPWLQLAPVHTI
jgi:phosphotransferase system HPr (HPr) family protein